MFKMKIHKFGNPATLSIRAADANKTRFLFRFEFLESEQPEFVEFETDAAGAMAIMKGL
jgi:hypothetical protein